MRILATFFTALALILLPQAVASEERQSRVDWFQMEDMRVSVVFPFSETESEQERLLRARDMLKKKAIERAPTLFWSREQLDDDGYSQFVEALSMMPMGMDILEVSTDYENRLFHATANIEVDWEQTSELMEKIRDGQMAMEQVQVQYDMLRQVELGKITSFHELLLTQAELSAATHVRDDFDPAHDTPQNDQERIAKRMWQEDVLFHVLKDVYVRLGEPTMSNLIPLRPQLFYDLEQDFIRFESEAPLLPGVKEYVAQHYPNASEITVDMEFEYLLEPWIEKFPFLANVNIMERLSPCITPVTAAQGMLSPKRFWREVRKPYDLEVGQRTGRVEIPNDWKWQRRALATIPEHDQLRNPEGGRAGRFLNVTIGLCIL